MLCYHGTKLSSIGYSDFDWAGDMNKWKLTTRYTLLLNRGAMTRLVRNKTAQPCPSRVSRGYCMFCCYVRSQMAEKLLTRPQC